MKAVFYCNKGPCREINQDGLFIRGQFINGTDEPQDMDFPTPTGLFAVIDGMGGMGGGEIATRLISESLVSDGMNDKPDCGIIELLIHNAATTLKKEAEKDLKLKRMGAAVAGIWFGEGYAFVFNCGDSRVYQICSGFLQKRSHDHSIVQELLDAGSIDEDEMRFHPRKNVITSAISAEDDHPAIFCVKIPVQPENKFLLCSDGLWEALSLETLEEILKEEVTVAAQLFVERCYASNAKDNFSFIIIEC